MMVAKGDLRRESTVKLSNVVIAIIFSFRYSDRQTTEKGERPMNTLACHLLHLNDFARVTSEVITFLSSLHSVFD